MELALLTPVTCVGGVLLPGVMTLGSEGPIFIIKMIIVVVFIVRNY